MAGNFFKNFRDWLKEKEDKRVELWILGAIMLVAAALLLMVLFTDRGLLVANTGSNRLYLLSSIIQGLAAILALLVTVSLVATQLAAGSYTPRVIKHHITNKWLWQAIGYYLLAIIWATLALSQFEKWAWFRERVQDSMDIALILTVTALVYIVPFTLATIKHLQPEYIAKRLVKDKNMGPLNDFMRKAINDGTITLTVDTLKILAVRAVQLIQVSEERETKAKEITELLTSIGRYACHKGNTEVVEQVMRMLTVLVTFCTEPPRQWRQAADIFNDAVKELYNYSSSLMEEG